LNFRITYILFILIITVYSCSVNRNFKLEKYISQREIKRKKNMPVASAKIFKDQIKEIGINKIIEEYDSVIVVFSYSYHASRYACSIILPEKNTVLLKYSPTSTLDTISLTRYNPTIVFHILSNQLNEHDSLDKQLSFYTRNSIIMQVTKSASNKYNVVQK
jgi:hypothetical protein